MSDGTRRKHAEQADPQTPGGPVEARVQGGWGEGPPTEHLPGSDTRGRGSVLAAQPGEHGKTLSGRPRRAKLTVSEACLNV